MIFFQLKEINTSDDKKVEFNDDKNQLIWFLQPQEAQFYLAAETLKHKPQMFVRTKLPFKPRKTSRMARKWPDIHEIQEYLSRLRASEVGVEGEVYRINDGVHTCRTPSHRWFLLLCF